MRWRRAVIDACAQHHLPDEGFRTGPNQGIGIPALHHRRQKKWNDEAFAYNSLVVAWPEIQDKAAQIADEQTELSLFE